MTHSAHPAGTIRVSTVLLTKNNMKSLPTYIASMRAIDDIIVLDGGSTDGTLEFLKTQPQCRVFPQNPKYLDDAGYITDFSAVRNEGYALAKHRWILCIDADESATEALLNQVRDIVDHGQPGVYYVDRLFTLHGKPVVGIGATDHIRLFHLSCVRGCIKPVHERLDIIAGSYIGRLHETIIVPLRPAKNERAKFNRFLRIEVSALAGMSMRMWFRWCLLRNIVSTLRRAVVVVIVRLIPKRGPRYPLSLEYEQLRYLWMLTLKTFPPINKKQKP